MEFTVQKEILANGIQIVQNAVTQKSSLPILSNVLIEVSDTDVKLTATDLDMGICSTIPILNGVRGACTVPAKKFFDIVRSLPDNSDIQVLLKKNNAVHIKSGKAQFKIIGLPKEDFPQLPFFEEKDTISIPQNVFKEMIILSDFSISKDDTRHVLTGMLLEVKGDEVKIVATDGRRMSVVNRKIDKKIPGERKAIISIKTVQEIKRILEDSGDVNIHFSDNQVKISFNNCFIISRLIEGEFPDYNRVIPEESSKVMEINREEFLDATRRVSILTDQESQAIKLSIQKKKITISKNTPYLGEAKEEVDVTFNSDDTMEIGFNPRYLVDVLRNLEDDIIKFEVNDLNKPGVIRKENEYVYVVLPMQFTS